MFNQEMGIINKVLLEVFNIAPRWYTNPWLARAALLIVNLWLGYPYWMLVTSGALQGIPTDIYEAAQIDGANGWQRFTKITLPPLLLVSVGPLMIASFIYNFNNFNLIYAFIGGWATHPNGNDRGRIHRHHHQLRLQPGLRQRTWRAIWLRIGHFADFVCPDRFHVAYPIPLYKYVGGNQ